MLEHKKNMIIQELKSASKEDIKDFLEALKVNEHYLKIYSEDINKASEEHLQWVKSEIITDFARG